MKRANGCGVASKAISLYSRGRGLTPAPRKTLWLRACLEAERFDR
jgi:hypothetical protein